MKNPMSATPPSEIVIRDEVLAQIEVLLTQSKKGPRWDAKLTDFKCSKWFLAAEPELQIESIHAGLERQYEIYSSKEYDKSEDFWRAGAALQALTTRLLKKKHPYTDSDLVALVNRVAQKPHYLPTRPIVSAVEKARKDQTPSPPLRAALKALRGAVGHYESWTRKLQLRIDALLAEPSAQGLMLEPVDAWTCAMQDELDAMPESSRAAWGQLLAHCATARSAKPSKKWSAAARQHIDAIGADGFRSVWERVAGAACTKADMPVMIPSPWGGGMTEGDPTLVSERYADCLRGLLWCAIPVENDRTLTVSGDVAIRAFKKLRGHGPLAPKIGNACLYVLSVAESIEAVGQLSRLATGVKHSSTKRQIERALERASELHGMGPDELEERGAPTCGLTRVGELEREMGDFVAVLRVESARSASLLWRKQDGKLQKTVPAAVKADHAEALADLKKHIKDLKKLLPAQAQRIERGFLSPRTLPFAEWREFYLDHVLVGTLARRLVWTFGSGKAACQGIWREGEIVDVEGAALELSDDTPVVLWHPIDSPVETVGAWRTWLHENGVTQPFKQAHREIYLVTDAERETGTYSNRFAAHILKQHQFAALCQDRGWRYSLMGAWDCHNTPTRDLPEHDLRIEYWVEMIETDHEGTSDHGIYLYVSTDQVRFYRMHQDGPMRVEDVPPRLFSELMRDVDLFVGVASVANDPSWVDGGPNGRHYAYWHHHAFGDLTESAKTRREVLERLVPQLKIADRCSLEDRFLHVRGDIRTYKIHLGSGNIQMTPNDEYLCIVPGRSGKGGDVALPFEGDGVLSIILSKAFMLAADTKIKEATIVSQIRLR